MHARILTYCSFLVAPRDSELSQARGDEVEEKPRPLQARRYPDAAVVRPDVPVVVLMDQHRPADGGTAHQATPYSLIISS